MDDKKVLEQIFRRLRDNFTFYLISKGRNKRKSQMYYDNYLEIRVLLNIYLDVSQSDIDKETQKAYNDYLRIFSK